MCGRKIVRNHRMHKQLRHAPSGLANMADDAPLKAFKLAHAVFCYRRKLFYLARKPAELATKPKSLAGNANSFTRPAECLARNGFKLVREVFCYRRNLFYLARKPTQPGD